MLTHVYNPSSLFRLFLNERAGLRQVGLSQGVGAAARATTAGAFRGRLLSVVETVETVTIHK